MLNLKKDKYITSYDVSFKFNEYKEYDNYDNLKGEVIIGELPDIYDSDNYFSEQYNTDYTYGGKNSIMYLILLIRLSRFLFCNRIDCTNQTAHYCVYRTCDTCCG